MPDPDETTTVLPMAEAASRLGVSVDAVRSRVRRGHLETRRGNDGKTLVLLPNSLLDRTRDEARLDHDEAGDEAVTVSREELARALADRDRARDEAELWRTRTETARLGAARAEAQLEAERESAEDRVAARNAVIEELRAELARLRLPFWRRWIG